VALVTGSVEARFADDNSIWYTFRPGTDAVEIAGMVKLSTNEWAALQVGSPTGQSAVSISNTDPAWYLSPATIVIATIQGNVPGTWVLGAYVNSTSKFTIRLNRAAPAQLVVGWFIVN
jgi:hypothetical protein